MGKISSNPIILDCLPKLKVSQLIDGYKPNTEIMGYISALPEKIDFNTYFIEVAGAVELQYSDGRSQTIRLSAVPSNLGKGLRWYMVCPVTCKRATFLYFHKGIFVHRTGIDNAYYAKQTESPLTRIYRVYCQICIQLITDDTLLPERLIKRFERYSNMIEMRLKPKFIDSVYDPNIRQIIS